MNFKKYILVVYILFCSLSLYSQSVKIIKDSVCIDGKYFELQELACGTPRVFHTIQEVFPIFGDTLFFGTYKERLNYKKKMILD